jgi:uncharacterized protein YfaS (alpha-2-macroglobulin family)
MLRALRLRSCTGLILAPVLALLLILAGGPAGPGPARADFDPPGLAADAGRYAAEIRARTPPQPSETARNAALRQARAALARKEPAKAVAGFETAIAQGAAQGAEDGAVWLELSAAWSAGPRPNRERAVQAAFLAYQESPAQEEDGPATRAAALWRLSLLLEEAPARPDQALQALRELAELAAEPPAESPGEHPGEPAGEPPGEPAGEHGKGAATRSPIAAAYPTLDARLQDLRQRVGLTLRTLAVDIDGATPRLCFTFADTLSHARGVRFEDFVRVEPAARPVAEVRDAELCLSGLEFGAPYTVTLRQGLPGHDGLTLKADTVQRVVIGNRTPSVAFRGNAFILPRGSGEGIPITAVNLDTVRVKVYRINDRGLARVLYNGEVPGAISRYAVEDIAETSGELVWEGRMDAHGAANAETTLALPFRDLVPDPRPGLYAVTAAPADVRSRLMPVFLATQWVLVSDIGLTSLMGADGLTVFARSFASARPLPGVAVTLVARNNAELARLTSDEAGRVRFPPALARGSGGNTPVAVMAYGGFDYAVLNLTDPAFDLADRGVGGRAPPGPMDAFLYTDRGVYRQGETVNLAIILRDDHTRAVEGFPLTVKVLRPGGTEYFAGPVPAGPAGSFFLPLALSRSAPLGAWTVQAFADPKAPPVGSLTFQVDDFVPERLALELTPPAPAIEPGRPFEVLASGRFLYGPPAAGLGGTAELTLAVDPAPWPQHTGFHFGLIQEEVTARRQPLEFPVSDANGRSRIAVTLPPLPDTTRPLKAGILATMTEPGGRPTRQSLSVPVRPPAGAIGLRPRFAGARLNEGQEAGFDIIAIAPDGTPVARPGLKWELVEEETTFQWYFTKGHYTWRAVTRDRLQRSGSLDVGAGNVGAGEPASLTIGPLAVGRYRLEVTDGASGAASPPASSLRFTSGWQPAAEAGDTPDRLEVTADGQAWRPGQTAHVRIAPPFAGEALVTVATDRLWESRTLSVPAEGVTLDIPVDAAWGPGAYVTATVYRPPVKGRGRQPVRAMGLTWLGVDPAVGTLSVGVEAPEVLRPRRKAEVAVKVAAADGGALDPDTIVTLAAVDEGILQLTGFATPDPVRHLFGKRRLGFDIRDDYGRLIDTLAGPMATLRQGGDGGGAALPVVPFTVVSLFSGPVKTGLDGVARIALDIPDFNGRLRLMAVAFSAGRVGSAGAFATVRDPLVADAVMPRFLAPGDDSRVTVSLHAAEAGGAEAGGAAGTWRVAVRGTDAVAVDGDATRTVTLAAGERRTLELPLKGLAAGIGHVTLSVRRAADGAADGGGGEAAVEHTYSLTVRPGQPPETRFIAERLAPGASVRLDGTALAGYQPGTAGLAVSYGAAPPIDAAGALAALLRYPYGCLEQAVSRGLPLLGVQDGDLPPGDNRAVRVQQAIAQVLDRQRHDGSFGLWSAADRPEPWLTAYALEFLVRARGQSFPVPEAPLLAGLAWLRRQAVDGGNDPAELAVRAYALHVLALAGVITPGPARYLHDTFLERLPTPLARAQLGAALARLGDRERAARAFAAATGRLARDTWSVDYGSTVRDAAALLVLLTEARESAGELAGDLDARLPALMDRLPAAATATALTSTQEQAWIVLAAGALTGGGSGGTGGNGNASVDMEVEGRGSLHGARLRLIPTAAELATGLPVRNAGNAPVWQAVSVAGVPAEPRPAAHEGLRIARQVFSRDGRPLDPASIPRNEVFVVVLEGGADTKLHHQALVVQPLPAGWEMESVRAGGAGFAWLRDLTGPRAMEGRDDRYVAAVDLTPTAPGFRLAFVVRAVTPGGYALPAAWVEDMVKPRFFARQGAGRTAVTP